MALTHINLLAGLFSAHSLLAPNLESSLRLPSGPRFDLPLIIFDRSFLSDGSIYVNSTGNNPSSPTARSRTASWSDGDVGRRGAWAAVVAEEDDGGARGPMNGVREASPAGGALVFQMALLRHQQEEREMERMKLENNLFHREN